MQPVELLPRDGFQASKLARYMLLDLTIESQVSAVPTSHTLVQLEAMPLCVGIELGAAVVDIGAVRIVGVPGTATQ